MFYCLRVGKIIWAATNLQFCCSVIFRSFYRASIMLLLLAGVTKIDWIAVIAKYYIPLNSQTTTILYVKYFQPADSTAHFVKLYAVSEKTPCTDSKNPFLSNNFEVVRDVFLVDNSAGSLASKKNFKKILLIWKRTLLYNNHIRVPSGPSRRIAGQSCKSWHRRHRHPTQTTVPLLDAGITLATEVTDFMSRRSV